MPPWVRSRARRELRPRVAGTVAHTVAYYPLNFVWTGTDPVEAVRWRAEGLGCKGEVAEGSIVVVTNRLLIDGVRRTQEIRLGRAVTYDDQIMTGVWAGIEGKRQYLRLGRGEIPVYKTERAAASFSAIPLLLSLRSLSRDAWYSPALLHSLPPPLLPPPPLDVISISSRREWRRRACTKTEPGR